MPSRTTRPGHRIARDPATRTVVGLASIAVAGPRSAASPTLRAPRPISPWEIGFPAGVRSRAASPREIGFPVGNRSRAVSPREIGRARLPRGRSASPREIGFPVGNRSGPASPRESDWATGREVRVYQRIAAVAPSACGASGGVNPGLAVSAELASASHAVWQQFNFWLQNHAKNRLFPPRSQDPTITRRVRLQCPDRLRRETNHDIRGVRQLRPHPRLLLK